MRRSDPARVDRFEVGVTRKVSLIEGQYALYPVHAHSGNQTCIVNLDATDGMLNNQPAPFLMN
jgi:hypothetical protein